MISQITWKLVWTDEAVLINMELTAWPCNNNLWGGAKYLFTIEVGEDFPH